MQATAECVVLLLLGCCYKTPTLLHMDCCWGLCGEWTVVWECAVYGLLLGTLGAWTGMGFSIQGLQAAKASSCTQLETDWVLKYEHCKQCSFLWV